MPDTAVVEIKRAARALMTAAGMTQEAIEAATGIDQSRISRITSETTRNRPTLYDLLKIEEACGEAPGYLLAAAGLTTIEGTEAGAQARVVGARRGTSR